ncbi:hypothetical protein FA95DRAFT_1595846 [Auriscalpium vulgare]|uniref:Uncharacterized protein n=1 Tax=Auriscalpium vulgare TaxID=40419 RepID=A0ACB8RSU8_9AGAM|nr:hypothetical protein FA95DRAFT_1595846 [Auriscalpium vulgare]
MSNMNQTKPKAAAPATLPPAALSGGYLAAAVSPAFAAGYLARLAGPAPALGVAPSGAPVVRGKAVARRGRVPLDYAYDARRGAVLPVPDALRLGAPRPEPPIWFVRAGPAGGLGVGAADVLGGRAGVVDGAERAWLAPEGCVSVDLGITWPGYHKYTHTMQIRSLDPHRPMPPPDIATFLWHIARTVEEFMTHASRREMGTPAPPHEMDVGIGVHVQDVTIIGAINVSEGRWYPVLRLPPAPR